MGCEIGRIRPTKVFERAGESRMTPPASSSLVPGEAEDLVLAPAGVVGEVEDVLPRGGQVGADGEVFGVLEEALAGEILPQAVGEAGHGVEPAPVDGEGAHAVEGRGFAIDGAGGRPGGAPGELVLADLIRGQRGGVCVAAEEGDEMGDPAAGGAPGPELPDLVVLEVGVAELSQGRPLGAERARVAAPSRGVYVRRAWSRSLGRRGRGHGDRGSTFAVVGATAEAECAGPSGHRDDSVGADRQGSGMCGGDGQPRRSVGHDRPGPRGSADRAAGDGGWRRVWPRRRDRAPWAGGGPRGGAAARRSGTAARPPPGST